MNEIQSLATMHWRFRSILISSACILGGLSLWMLASETLRPRVRLTRELHLVAQSRELGNAAFRAARIGAVRGDLWADAAFALGGQALPSNKGEPIGKLPLDRALVATEQGIKFAPHDARLWLLLAAYYFRTNWLSERSAAALKMSYYTGPNTFEVVPERLLLAVQSRALNDSEFQELVRHDVQFAIRNKAELLPALLSAYDTAPQSGREFLEKAIEEIDPAFLKAVRSAGSPKPH